MSLQTRLSALITAVGADIKALQARTPTVLSGSTPSLPGTTISDTSQPTNALESRVGGTAAGNLLMKFLTTNPISSGLFQNRTDLWLRVKSRDNVQSIDRLVLNSDGESMFLQLAAASGYKMQFGSVQKAVSASPTDGVDVNVALAAAWPNEHLIYLAQAWPLSTWSGFHHRASGPSDLASGLVHLDSPAQNVLVRYISIGK